MKFKVNNLGGWIVPINTALAANAVIPAYSTLGDHCKLGCGCKLGDGCKLGCDCKLGCGCDLGCDCKRGAGCKLGCDCTLEGLVCKRFMNLSNIDGSGRQLLVVTDGLHTVVRAGCFRGSAKEFVVRAREENKLVYAAVVPAAVKAWLKEINRV